MQGWIKIHRQLLDNDLWNSEPFTRGQAWIDLLLLANHKPGFIRKRGIKIDIEPGQVGWSALALSHRWKWSRGKVDRFLKELENGQQIVQQKNRITTVITLINWDKYQNDGQQIVQQTDNRRTTNDTTDGQQTDTNKNDKKEKNVKNEKNEKKIERPAKKIKPGANIPPTQDQVDLYFQSKGGPLKESESFFNYYESKGWKVGRANMKNWHAAANNWIKRIDNFTNGQQQKTATGPGTNNGDIIVNGVNVSAHERRARERAEERRRYRAIEQQQDDTTSD